MNPQTANRATRTLLMFVLAIWAGLAVACVFLISLGTDEAWVLNGLRSALRPPVADLSSPIVVTSAGLSAVGNLAIEATLGNRVWAHRLFSLACLTAVVVFVYARYAKRWNSRLAGLLAITPFASLPGSAEIGTVALGYSCALLLLILAAWLWTRDERPGPGKVASCAILLGLAAASRLEIVLALPALFVADCLRIDRNGVRAQRPSLALVLVVTGAAAILMLNMIVVRMGTQPGIPTLEDAQLWNAIGVGSPANKIVNYPLFLNKLFVGLGFVPLFVLFLAATLPFWDAAHTGPQGEENGQFEWVMVVAGVLLWAGWVFAAPIPHLRYLWPALACLAIAAGAGLASLHAAAQFQRRTAAVSALQLLAVCLVLGGILGSLRSIVLGEHDYLSWEWSREMGADYYRRFQAPQDQAAAARYLNDVAHNYAAVYSFAPPYILRYLADRPVIDMTTAVEQRGSTALTPQRPCCVVFPPAIGTYLYMRPAAHGWFAREGRLVGEFGHYAFLQIDGPWPDDPSMLLPVRGNYEAHPNATPWFGRGHTHKRRTENAQ